MLFQPLSPKWTLVTVVFFAALVLQWLSAGLLLRAQRAQSAADLRRQNVEIAQDLAGQASRAQSANDDLAALNVLRSAREHFTQLREALIIDAAGLIQLHTDAGQVGKLFPLTPGPRLSSPEVTEARSGGRTLLRVRVPLPDQDEGYFCAVFDVSRADQRRSAQAVRFFLLIFLVSAALAGIIGFWLRRYALADPQARMAPPAAPKNAGSAALALAAEWAEAQPQAALVLDRDHRILAVNARAAADLAVGPVSLTGQHVADLAWPEPLLTLYQQGVRSPEIPAAGTVTLPGRNRAAAVQVLCFPAGPAWALVRVIWS